GDYAINYQPYVATVGAGATQGEKDKVNKTINLPDFLGYDKPQGNFPIGYDTVVKEAKTGEQSGDDEYGKTYQKTQF
ncbi:hypothetical protein OJ615_11535, partial [Streptococcus anginosus]|nr:hypothetical protein [Streptococcus anginosus]